MPVEQLALSRTFSGTQIIDGNNFFINRITSDENKGMVYRNLISDIEQCPVPPIFVWDGPNAKAMRRKFFPGYKVGKPPTGEDIYAAMDFFRSLCPHLPVVSVRVPNWEADDVIATLALDMPTDVLVVSTDRDLAQLKVHPHVTVTNEYKTVLPADIRLYKTMKGDSSDKIPGLPGFGDKMWENVNTGALGDIFERGQHFFDYGPAALGMSPRLHSLAIAVEDELRVFYKIVGLFDVPMAEIEPELLIGTPNRALVNNTLTEWLM